jgi:hypothetical protein
VSALLSLPGKFGFPETETDGSDFISSQEELQTLGSVSFDGGFTHAAVRFL